MNADVAKLLLVVVIGICIYLVFSLRRMSGEVKHLKELLPSDVTPASYTGPEPVKVPASPETQIPAPVTQTPLRSPSAPPVPEGINPAPLGYSDTASVAYGQPSLAPAENKPSVESVLGRNVLGILAALLIFAGLVFFASIVFPALPNAARIALMFATAICFLIVGGALSEKQTTPFAQALLGTGVGAGFISLFMTNVYFHFLGDIPTLVLLLAWLALGLFLTKRYASIVLALISQIGMVISVLFAYARGFSQEGFFIVVVYQLLSSALVCFAFERWMDKRKRWGLFSSLAVCVGATNVITVVTHLNPQPIMGLLVIQLIAACVFVVLIVRSLMEEGDPDKQLLAFSIAHLLLCDVVFIVLGNEVPHMLAEETSFFDPLDTIWMGTICASVAAIVFGATELWAVQRGAISHKLASTGIIIFASFITALAALRFPISNHIPLLVVVGLLLWGAGKQLPSTKLCTISVIWVVLDAFLMVFGGYERLSERFGWWTSLVYLALLLILAILWWNMLGHAQKPNMGSAFLLGCLLIFEFSLGSVTQPLGSELSVSVSFIAALGVLLAIALTQTDVAMTANVDGSGFALKLNELVVMLFCCVAVAARSFSWASERDTPETLAELISLGLCIALLVIRWPETKHFKYPFDQVRLGLVGSAIVFALVQGFIPGVAPIVVTVACMLAALAFVLLGFAQRLTVLRLESLVLVIACVLKLVTLDVVSNSSIVRVVSLIAGGLICFGISAIYTYAVKRFENTGDTR